MLLAVPVQLVLLSIYPYGANTTTTSLSFGHLGLYSFKPALFKNDSKFFFKERGKSLSDAYKFDMK